MATGVRQPEASALYERCGYLSAEPYGKYVGVPLIRCYEKALPSRCGHSGPCAHDAEVHPGARGG